VPYARHYRKHKDVVRSSVDPNSSDGLVSARNYSSASTSSFSRRQPKMFCSRLNVQAQAISHPDGVLTMDSYKIVYSSTLDDGIELARYKILSHHSSVLSLSFARMSSGAKADHS
jgi:hypothetical protein